MPPPRILCLHAGALGDCVLAIHFVRMLDVAPPLVGGDRSNVAPPLVSDDECQTNVTIAARSSMVHWAKRSGLIGNAIDLNSIAPSLWRPDNTPPTANWVDFLASFDAVVSLLGDPHDPVSASLRRDCSTNLHCIDPRPAPSPNGEPRHIVDQWLHQLDPPFRSAWHRQAPLVTASPQVRAALSNRCRSTDRPIVLIHPGSGGQSKCCKWEALETLIPVLQRNNLTPAWIIGPDEMERLGDSYARRLESTAPLLYEESVIAAADLVSAADAYIGMDAGMTHGAALAGVTTVALFGPTDPTVWRPLGRSVHVLPFPTDSPPSTDWIQKIERCVQPG